MYSVVLTPNAMTFWPLSSSHSKSMGWRKCMLHLASGPKQINKSNSLMTSKRQSSSQSKVLYFVLIIPELLAEKGQRLPNTVHPPPHQRSLRRLSWGRWLIQKANNYPPTTTEGTVPLVNVYHDPSLWVTTTKIVVFRAAFPHSQRRHFGLTTGCLCFSC